MIPLIPLAETGTPSRLAFVIPGDDKLRPAKRTHSELRNASLDQKIGSDIQFKKLLWVISYSSYFERLFLKYHDTVLSIASSKPIYVFSLAPKESLRRWHERRRIPKGLL